MKVVDNYPMQAMMPPVCYFCFADKRWDNDWPQGEPIIETGKFIEFEGFMHICGSCIRDMALMIGFVQPDQIAARNAENDWLIQRVTELEQERDHQIEANRVLASGILQTALSD